jgi:hypothetical protein
LLTKLRIKFDNILIGVHLGWLFHKKHMATLVFS